MCSIDDLRVFLWFALKMFSTSTHRKHWMFQDEAEISHLKLEAHEAFINSAMKGSTDAGDQLDLYLHPQEAEILLTFFERKLMDFCLKFKPPMPKAVIGTAFAYFKRFYLSNSVMDYHPKEIL